MLNTRTFLASALALTSIAASAQSHRAPNWSNYIQSGRTFQIDLDVPFNAQGNPRPLGVLLPGGTYQVKFQYNGNQHMLKTSGFHIGQNTFVTQSCKNPDIEKNIIHLWDRPMQFCEDGSLFDFKYGRVGTLRTNNAIHDRINAGCRLMVTFEYCTFDDTGLTPNDPMGDLLAGASYVGHYKSETNAFTIEGFHEESNGNAKLTYSNANLNHNQISLWGRQYRFDEFGYVYDQDYGMVGYIFFPRMTWDDDTVYQNQDEESL